MTTKLAQFSTNILFALVMGVFWGTWFALSRSIAALCEQTFLDIGHTTIRNLGFPMSILMPLSLVSAIVLLVLLPKRSAAFALALAGFFLMIVALIVTLTIEVPIDRLIEQWTVATLPSDWRELRESLGVLPCAANIHIHRRARVHFGRQSREQPIKQFHGQSLIGQDVIEHALISETPLRSRLHPAAASSARAES